MAIEGSLPNLRMVTNRAGTIFTKTFGNYELYLRQNTLHYRILTIT